MQTARENSLGDEARSYWSLGLPVVPLRGKEPLVKWEKWQTQPQTREEFESLPWDNADGYAVICGSQTKDGLFFCAVDFDVKNLPKTVTEKGEQALKKLPITQIEKTPNGGQHWIYFSRKKPRTISVYHNDCGLELLGEGKLCIMAPSKGYKRLNDNLPSIVESLEELFLDALRHCGVETRTAAWFNMKDLAETGKPYEGKNPPCINGLLEGTVEGQRNEYAIRLASYMINFRKLKPEYVLKRLKRWNSQNKPPLEDKELENVVKSVVKGGYNYGCRDPVLQRHCKKKECPLAQYNMLELMTEEEKQRAQALLKDPKILDYIVEFGRRRLIGEDNALLINFVALCSGQTRYPLSVAITGYSGSGKNESLRAVKPLIPEEWIFEFTTSTPEALKYIPEQFKGTLIAYEILGVKGESGKIALRAVGEGENIKTIYPAKNPRTGKISLEEAETNARNFITTSTQIDIDSDLYRRVFRITMKHDTELTKQVIRKKISGASTPGFLKEKLSSAERLPYSEEDFQNALRLNEWQHEAVVFAPPEFENIIDLAQTVEQEVALRGQVERILNFAKVLAIIQQKRRKRIKINGEKCVIADPEDFFKALEILQESIAETVTRISKRHREVIELLKGHEYVETDMVADKLKISQKHAWRLLQSLANQGYVIVDKSEKKHKYRLKDVENEKKLENVLIDKMRTSYESFWKKQFGNILRNMFASSHASIKKLEPRKVKDETVVLTFKQFADSIRGNKEIREKVKDKKTIIIKTEDATVNPLYTRMRTCEHPSSHKTAAFSEKKAEDILKQPMRTLTESFQEKKPKTQETQEEYPAKPKKRLTFFFRRIKPAEPCEKCGRWATEYIINKDDGTILRRCEHCFKDLQKKLKAIDFVDSASIERG